MTINFSTVSARSWYGRLLRLPLKLLPPTTIVPIIQGELRGYKWIVGSSIHGCWLGTYELEKQRAIALALKPGLVFYDIGANVGFYTLLAAVRVGRNGYVHAFEPVPRNINYIQRHITLNKLSNVTLHQLAVTDENREMRFALGPNAAEGHLDIHGDLNVQAVALDKYIADNRLPYPNLLKIDVEGAEYQVLRGARQTLGQNPVTVFLATHSPEIKHLCVQFLQDLGYRVESLDGKPLHFSERLGELRAVKE